MTRRARAWAWAYVGFAAAAAASSEARADDACVADGDWKPLLADAHPLHAAVGVKRIKGTRVLEETVRLRAPAVTLRLTQGGCAHYGLTYRFEGVRVVAPFTRVAAWSAEAARLLRLPLGIGGKALDAPLAGNVAKAKKITEGDACGARECAVSFACGQEFATCHYRVARAGAGRATLEIVYDFAL